MGRAAGDVRLKDDSIATLRPMAAHRYFCNLLYFSYTPSTGIRGYFGMSQEIVRKRLIFHVSQSEKVCFPPTLRFSSSLLRLLG